jgi:hypothetical protein
MRDSYKLLMTSYQEFEQQFGGKTVLEGLHKVTKAVSGHLKNHT